MYDKKIREIKNKGVIPMAKAAIQIRVVTFDNFEALNLEVNFKLLKFEKYIFKFIRNVENINKSELK